MPIYGAIDDAIAEITRRLVNLLNVNPKNQDVDNAVSVVDPGFIGVANIQFRRGDLVTFDGLGVRKATVDDRVVGVALDRNHVMFEGNRVQASMAYAPNEASWAGLGSSVYETLQDRRGLVGRAQYQYTKFPEPVEQRAWELLKKYMTSEQHFAFMEGSTIELENQAQDHRLLISKSGDFTILQGPRGAAITQASGTIRSYKYPLGDEIAAFLDWFNHKTLELIANWHCGTFGIKKEGELG